MIVIRIFFLAIFMFTGPALGQSVLEQLEAGQQIFLGGTSVERSNYSAQYRRNLLADLDGNWIPALLFPPEDFPSLCERQPIKIKVDNGYSFLMEIGVDGARQRIDRYFYQAGQQFVHISPPTDIAKYYGLEGDSEFDARMLEQTLTAFNRQVSVFRPSNDVLVVLPDTRFAEMYVRCPNGG